MKTNNFKMAFLCIEGFKYTDITFGYTHIKVYLNECVAPDSTCSVDEHFRFSYENNGKLMMSLATYDLPLFLYSQVRSLYYGFFAYDKVPFYKSPALECVGVIRSLQNYCKRKGINYL